MSWTESGRRVRDRRELCSVVALISFCPYIKSEVIICPEDE